MKIFYNKVFKNCALITFTLFLSEIIFRILVKLPFLDFALLRSFLGISILAWIFGTLFTFTRRVLNNILVFLFCFLFTFYGFIQVIFYNTLGNFFSFSSFTYVSMVVEGGYPFLCSIPLSSYFLILPLLLLLFFLIFIDKKVQILQLNERIDFSDKFDSIERKDLNEKNYKKNQKKSLLSNRLGALLVILISCFCFYGTLVLPFMQNPLQIKSSFSLFLNPDIPNIAINQFGYSSYAILDIKNMLFPSIRTKIDSPYQYSYEKKEQEAGSMTRYVDDSLWEKELSSELNRNYKLLGNYFISQEITNKNDYTGIFKDKNLIFIMMDSVNTMLIEEEYFPNVYHLYNNGWSFENAYSYRSSCSSGDSEFVAQTSLFPISSVCTAHTYQNNAYPESLFSLFKNEKYDTSSFSNYTDQFYSRSKLHSNMGVDAYYNASDLGIPYTDLYGQWPSDRELIAKMLDVTEDKEHFLVWLTTTSTVGPYDEASEIGDKHLELFKDTNYDIRIKRYLSKLKELDLAIGDLMEGLEKHGKLEDTVLILYGNHAPVGLRSSLLSSYFGYDITKSNEIDCTPFIVYNEKITPTKYKEYISPIQFTPTIANLFGLEYDPRKYVGQDVFSNTYENRVIYPDGSWLDGKGYYDAKVGKFVYFKADNTYSLKELNSINEEISLRISMSHLAIKTNYFQYLYNKFDEYTVSPIN